MTQTVHVTVQDGRIPLSRARVAEIATRVLRAEGARDAEVSITFLSNRAIAALNVAHLGHRGPTDVISFGFAPAAPGAPITGDIYIAPDVARTHAQRFGVPVREELARLVVHGTLHVLGRTHPEGDARTRSPMWRRQEELLSRILATPASARGERSRTRTGRPSRRASGSDRSRGKGT
jgi:probable rRNA maturation factor